MPFLLGNWKLIAVGLLVAALGGYIGMLILERDHYRSKLNADQIEIQSIKDQSAALLKQRDVEIAATEAKHAAETKEIKNVYDKQLADAKRRGNRGIDCRVRVPAHSDSVAGSQAPIPSTGADAATTNAMVARLPQDCTITTAMVLGLQKFVLEECR